MKLVKILALSAAIGSLSATPAMAESVKSQPAVTMHAPQRVGAHVKGEKQSSAIDFVPIVLATAAVGGGIALAITGDDNDNETPDSP